MGRFLLLVRQPDGNWMILTDTEEKAEAQKEYDARVDSEMLMLDTSDYVTIA